MENVTLLKTILLGLFGTIGAFITQLLGGWDMALQTLIICMIGDYITGMLLAIVFKKSPKTLSGTLDSRVGWKGLCRKGMTLLIVLIAVRLDMMVHTDYIRDAVVIAFVVNESNSILENAGLMGLPIPNLIKKIIDVLQQKAEKGDSK